MGKSHDLATYAGGTIAEDVILGGSTDISMDGSSSGQISIDGNGYNGAIALDGTGMNIYHNSSSRSLSFGTNETTRMTIDASGRVTMPYQLHISGTPNNSGGNGIANAFYTYQTPVGLSFSNSRITVPIAGNYMICWNTICDSGTGRVDTYIRVNGSQITNGMGDSNHTDFRYRGNAVVVRLAENDYIQFEHQDYYAASNIASNAVFNNWNHASVTLLG